MDNQKKIIEQQLLERLQGSDQIAYNWLFRQYYREAYRSAYRILRAQQPAEDIAQDVFAKIWNMRHTLNIKTSFRDYVVRAACNAAINAWNKNQRETLGDEDFDTLVEDYGAMEALSANMDDDQQELQQRLLLAIQELPERRRQVFQLHRLEKYSHREIADMLNISTKTIENHINQAMHQLRKAMDEHRSTLLVLIFIFHFLSRI